MLELNTPKELHERCEHERRAGRRVGLVPTMGYLHAGHLSLVQLARKQAGFVVVTAFVNPTQFGPAEDLSRYPRDEAGDRSKCLEAGVDCLFLPAPLAVYPEGFQTHVHVEQLSQGLCGARRPGHFQGVATVVTKLFNMVGPCVAVFGEKDYQQLQVIRRLVTDLNLPVEVLGGPIVREADGLAMSSRNVNLSAAQRAQATCLYRALCAVRAAGNGSAAEAVARARAAIEPEPEARIDYIEVRDVETLLPVDQVRVGHTLMAMAVFVGQTRLIDNMRI